MTRMSNVDLAKLLSGNPDVSMAGGPITKADPRVSVSLSEHELQTLVFAECAHRFVTMPELSLLMAIPNGQYRKGQRPEPGIMPGAFDMFLPVPSEQFHGLWIELKVGRNKPSRAQLDFMRRMQHQGYKCVVVHDSVDAVLDTIADYLEGE